MYKYTKTEKHKKQKMNTYIHTKTQPKQEEKKIITKNMCNTNEFNTSTIIICIHFFNLVGC